MTRQEHIEESRRISAKFGPLLKSTELGKIGPLKGYEWSPTTVLNEYGESWWVANVGSMKAYVKGRVQVKKPDKPVYESFSIRYIREPMNHVPEEWDKLTKLVKFLDGADPRGSSAQLYYAQVWIDERDTLLTAAVVRLQNLFHLPEDAWSSRPVNEKGSAWFRFVSFDHPLLAGYVWQSADLVTVDSSIGASALGAL